MDDSPMSLPPTPETKLRDGYKVTNGQPAFTTCEHRNSTRIRRRARHLGFHSHISSYSSMVAPCAPLVRWRSFDPREGAPTEGRPYRLMMLLQARRAYQPANRK